MRWRDKPRRPLRRWDVGKEYGLYLILLGTAWVIAVTYLGAAALGRPDPSGGESRAGSAVYGLGALIVAVALTRLMVLYLRRPLVPEVRKVDSDEVPHDRRLRDEAEQSARSHRIGPGY